MLPTGTNAMQADVLHTVVFRLVMSTLIISTLVISIVCSFENQYAPAPKKYKFISVTVRKENQNEKLDSGAITCDPVFRM